MPKYDYDMIVIGGGAAGLTASTFAGQSAAKTLLVEKDKRLGGDCLHYGCVPSKSLIKSAYIYHAMKNSEKYGLPKLEIPPVDFQNVAGRIQGIVGTIQKHDEPGYIKEKYNVETRFGEAMFLDPHTILLDGQKISARYFILATGSVPFIPPVEGINTVPYITNVDIFSLEKLPESMIVLGGGPIGTEMAQAFCRLGCKVTVVQSGPRILPKEDEDVSEFIAGLLKEEGIEFIFNASAKKAEQTPKGVRLTLEHGDEIRMLEAEKLLVAVGRRPNVDGLDLERAGVRYDWRGVKVDRHLRTGAAHIFACGDVNGKFPFTHVASYEAVTAVLNALYKVPKRVDYTKVPWCTYLDPQIASIGYNELRAKEAGLDIVVHKESFERNDRALAEGEARGFIKIILSKGRVIGVQIASFYAGDLISEWIPVINGSGKLSPIADSVHPYPTMAEMNKNASVNYMVSTVPPYSKKALKLLFGYQGKI